MKKTVYVYLAILMILFLWSSCAYASPEEWTFLWPVKNQTTWEISSGYGPRNGKLHAGIDFSVSQGAELYLPVDGQIYNIYDGCININSITNRKGCDQKGCHPTRNGVDTLFSSMTWNYADGSKTFQICNQGFGNGVAVKYTSKNDGVYYLSFAHLSEVNPALKVGQTYKAGTPIGKAGSAGFSTGIHCHFEIDQTFQKTATSINPNRVNWDFSWWKENQIERQSCNTIRATSLYSSTDMTTPALSVPKGYGLVIVSQTKDEKMYRTSKGYYVLVSDIDTTSKKANTQIGAYTKVTDMKVSLVTTQVLDSNEEPYAAAIPVRSSIPKGTTINIIAVYTNKYGNYWVETDEHSFIIAKKLKTILCLNSPLSLSVANPSTDKIYPESNYDITGKTSLGIKQSGIITSSNGMIKSVSAYWYKVDNMAATIVATSGAIPVDDYRFDIKGSAIQSKLDSSLLINSGNGTYFYIVEVKYYDYNGTTADAVSPLVEKQQRIIDYKFTLNGGGSGSAPVPTLVPVGQTYVTSVTLNRTSASMTIGSTLSLAATVTPANASDTSLTWFSTDESVATVANGVVTAKGAGTATIVAQANDAGKKTGTCTVTVVPNVTATFDANGGNVQGSSSITVSSGAALGTLPTATRTGYTFAGWFTAASGGTQISVTTTITSNVTFYAHWNNTAPIVNSATISNVTKDGYDVTVTVADAEGLQSLALRTWNDSIGIGVAHWDYPVVSGKSATVTFHIDVSKYDNRRDVKYYTNVYAIDAAGCWTPAEMIKSVSAFIDGTAPVVTSTTITNVTKDGYDVTCTFTDNVGVTRIEFATWIRDDYEGTLKWNDGTVNGNSATMHVSVSDFGGRTNCMYETSCWAWDAAGHRSDVYAGQAYELVFIDSTAPVVISTTITNVTKDGYDVTCTFQDNGTVASVQFDTFLNSKYSTTSNNQTAVINGNTATAHVSFADFGNVKDWHYRSVALVTDACGNKADFNTENAWDEVFIDGTAPVIDTSKTTVKNVTSTGYDIVISATDNHELSHVESRVSIWQVDGSTKLKDWVRSGRADMSGTSSEAIIHVNFEDYGTLKGVSYANTVKVYDTMGNCSDYKLSTDVHYDLGNNETGMCGDNVYWTLDKTTGTMRIYGTGKIRDFTMDEKRWNGSQERVKKLVIESGVTSIGNYAFMGFTYLTDISLPEGLTRIGNSGFADCTNLKAIDLPSTVSALDNYVFKHCYNLKTVTIPEGVTYISYGLFWWSNIESVVLPASTNIITDAAFYGCYKLELVYFKGSGAKWDGISINAANNSCLLNAPVICDYPNDKALQSVMKLPDALREIELEAFQNVAAEIIIIPAGVEYIGARAFNECPNLKYIINYSEVGFRAPTGVRIIIK